MNSTILLILVKRKKMFSLSELLFNILQPQLDPGEDNYPSNAHECLVGE